MKRLTYKISIVGISLVLLACAPKKEKNDDGTATLIYQDDFESGFSNWVAEAEDPETKIETEDGKLVIDAPGGVTLWFKEKLNGNILIEYKRKVIVDGGPNDRLSDFNQFWMATDPRSENLFTRSGKFSEYHPLSLYYVGFGGNNNSTTRFRKYDGNGKRELLEEYTAEERLLKANKTYHIKTVCRDGVTRFFVDGEEYFSLDDQNPLRSGHFGFRLVGSRQEIDDFRVYQLE